MSALWLMVLMQVGPEADLPVPSPWTGYLCLGLGGLFGLVSFAYGLFWLWMLVHCLLYEPDKYPWIFVIALVPFPGPILYAALRVVPQKQWHAPRWIQRLTRGRELKRLETATEMIGNAHQFIQWGDALRETGQLAEATDAYAQALKKDATSLPALWGAAQVAQQQRRFADAKEFCRQILDRDPQYKFGDVSLAYARALGDLADFTTMRTHLEQHVRRWRHPEAVYLLAERCRADGELATAREHYQGLLRDIHSSPTAIARKFGRWQSLAQKSLKKLERG